MRKGTLRQALEASMREGLICIERYDNDSGKRLLALEVVSIAYATDVAVEYVRCELKDRLRPTTN